MDAMELRRLILEALPQGEVMRLAKELHVIERQSVVELAELVNAMVLNAKTNPIRWASIIDMLQHEISGIVPCNPEGGKEARAAAVQPLAEAGNIYLPDGVDWLDDFVAEFSNFPRGRHDDQVDALSQALLELGLSEPSTAENWLRMDVDRLTDTFDSMSRPWHWYRAGF